MNFLQGQHPYSPHPGVEAQPRPLQWRVHGGPGPVPLRQRDKQCGSGPAGIPGEGPCRPGQDPEGLLHARGHHPASCHGYREETKVNK